MGILVKAGNGVYKSKDFQMTEYLWKARENKPFWEAVGEVIKAFKKREPRRYDAYIIRMKQLRRSQKKTWVGNSEFSGVVKDRKNDALFSMVCDFPVWIHLCLKKLYPEKSNYLNSKKFFRSFAARFPSFRVREKL